MNKLTCYLFLAIEIFVISGCNPKTLEEAQIFNGDYWGKPVPGDSAIVFAPGILSTNNHEHSRLNFSKDGSEIFWAVIPVDMTQRSETGRPFLPDLQNIWYTKKTETGWTTPGIFSITAKFSASRPAYSVDGKTLYYISPDPNANPDERPKPTLLYGTSRNNGEWINPVVVDSILPKKKGMASMSFCFANNGNVYFDYGGPDDSGEWLWKMYFAEFKNGKYGDPILLPEIINGGEIDWCPWISPDESYLIWSSHRENDYGSGDLYISYKNEDGSWSSPINLGSKINTSGQERFPSITPDGKYLFFARHTDDITYSDYYWVDGKIVKVLNEKIR